jgi:HemK-like putative methylase
VGVDFSEINPKFIKQIKKNLKLNFPKITSENLNTITQNFRSPKIFQSDIFEKIPQNNQYDYILTNPPYIPENKKIDDSVKKFEDYNSLFAEDDGLFFIKKIILEAPKFLKKKGKIFIEFDETSKKNIENFLQENKIKNYKFKKDQYKNDRVLIITF